MADFGNVDTMLNGLDDDRTIQILKRVFEYVLKDLRIGRAIDGDPSKNFGAGIFAGTTPAIANTEFSVEHSFGRIPYGFQHWTPLDTVNASTPVLTVARAADAHRMYFKSAAASAHFFILVEG